MRTFDDPFISHRPFIVCCPCFHDGGSCVSTQSANVLWDFLLIVVIPFSLVRFYGMAPTRCAIMQEGASLAPARALYRDVIKVDFCHRWHRRKGPLKGMAAIPTFLVWFFGRKKELQDLVDGVICRRGDVWQSASQSNILCLEYIQ
jgi:hypothetical protein